MVAPQPGRRAPRPLPARGLSLGLAVALSRRRSTELDNREVKKTRRYYLGEHLFSKYSVLINALAYGLQTIINIVSRL